MLRANWPLKSCLIFLCPHILLLITLGAMQFKGPSGQIMTHLTPLLDNAFIITDLSALGVFYVISARIRKTSTGGSGAMGVI